MNYAECNAKQAIFIDEKDRDRFFDVLPIGVERFNLTSLTKAYRLHLISGPEGHADLISKYTISHKFIRKRRHT